MRSKTKITGIITLVLVLSIGGSLAWKHFHNQAAQKENHSGTTVSSRKINDVDYGPPTDAQKQAGQSTKDSSGTSESGGSSSSDSGQQASTGTITISRAGQATGSTTVSLRAIVAGLSSGNCVAVFTKDGQPSVQQSVAIVSSATYYSCAPLDISIDQFSVSGTWNVSVHAVDSGSATVSNTATTTVKVQK